MIYLLTIRGTAEWRICTSTSAVSIYEQSTGTTRVFWPGMEDPQIEESADSTDGMEVPVSVILPPEAWRAFTESDTAGWTAEIAEYRAGGDWRSRIVRVDGYIDQDVVGAIGDAVEFSVIENVWEDRSLFPPPGQQAGAATWPVSGSTIVPESVEGIWYPWVFGCPGYVHASTSLTDMFGWEAILVEIDASTGNNFDSGALDATVLIAGHVCGFSSVKLYNRTTGNSATVATTTTRDLLQNVVTVAVVAGADLEISDGDELWASAVSLSASGLAADPTRPMRGAGQIVAWLLGRSTIRFDRTMLALLSRLDRFKVDFFINDPQSAWAIIQDTILANSLIPAFWRRSQWGYFLAVQPFDTTTPVMQIRPEEGWERDGGLTRSTQKDIVTDATVIYAEDTAQGASLLRLTYGPRETAGVSQSPYLASAYGALKIRRAVEIAAPGIQDPGTARLILDLFCRRNSTTIRSGAFVCQRTDTGAQIGQVVSVTCPPLNLSARLCWITGVQISLTETRITIETLPDLQRTGPT